jgi:uncharacterized membrane protein YfcA
LEFHALVVAAALVAGAIASVSGFGIGSILTPVFNTHVDMRLAVAAVSIPHLIATFVRFWTLRRDTDWSVLKTFGLMSAAGGLLGALLQQTATSPVLMFVFAGVLVFVGLAGLSGLSQRLRFGKAAGWAAGAASGFLGGLVGNQGGIRSAALLGYELSPSAFVATATAIALIVDFARMPVYIVSEGHRLAELRLAIVLALVATVAGTVLGERILARIPRPLFRRLVALLVLVLGVYMFCRAARIL